MPGLTMVAIHGPTGARGLTGASGPTGHAGPTGIPGSGMPKSMQQVREWDLNRQHLSDSLRASLKGDNPQSWQMFAQEGSVNDGVWTRAWCVYSCDNHDRAYENGLWFNNEKVAIAVLAWKRERAGKRPWYVTRIAARLWRMLPWR